MRSIQELQAEEARVQAILDAGAETELRAIPGVVHVSVGLKQINGTATDEICIRVYVAEKKPADAVPPAQRIPKRIQGITTDVNQVKVVKAFNDTARYRPLIGGIQITNGLPIPGGFGTLGCLATDDLDGKQVLLTNFHVIGGASGTPVFQPDSPLAADQIATVKRGWVDGVIDAAIAEIAPGIATTVDEVHALAIGGSNHLSGTTFPISGMIVYKVGKKTGRTEGKVVDPNAVMSFDFEPPIGVMPMSKLMLVQGTRISTCCCCSCTVADKSIMFSNHGDSGAVIVTQDRRVIGLLIGGDPGETAACRITEIQTRLNISVNTAPVVPHGLVGAEPDSTLTPHAGALTPFAARAAAADAFPGADDPSVWALMQRRLEETEFGRELGLQVRHHLPEAIELVNRHRAVMVTWQRVEGPSFLAQWMNGVRNPSQPVPKEINGVTMTGALLKLSSVLKAHGSDALRRSIDEHGIDLMALLDRSATVDELIENLDKPVTV